MRIPSPVLAAVATLLLAIPMAAAAAYRLGGIEVTQAWTRSAAAGTNGAGFMTVTNHGKSADTLVSVESPAAERVEMHKTTMADAIMSMQRLDAGLPLAPGQSVTFAPGSYHLMLVRLVRALKTGDLVPATLVFSSGARLQVTFPVRKTAPSTGGMEPMDGMEHMRH